MEAGRALRNGSRSLDHLTSIVRWKSKRRAALLEKNTAALVAEVLDIALSAKSDRVAIVALTALDGVGIPMASAIMTCVDPDRFTIIDVRALGTLGEANRSVTPAVYEQYLVYCRKEAKRLRVPLRAFDRAIWESGAPALAADRSSM